MTEDPKAPHSESVRHVIRTATDFAAGRIDGRRFVDLLEGYAFGNELLALDGLSAKDKYVITHIARCLADNYLPEEDDEDAMRAEVRIELAKLDAR